MVVMGSVVVVVVDVVLEVVVEVGRVSGRVVVVVVLVVVVVAELVKSPPSDVVAWSLLWPMAVDSDSPRANSMIVTAAREMAKTSEIAET